MVLSKRSRKKDRQGSGSPSLSGSDHGQGRAAKSPLDNQHTPVSRNSPLHREDKEEEEEEEDLWSDRNVAAVADLWDLSNDQVSSLKEIQQLLKDVDHWKNDPYEVVRYLCEYRSVAKATMMFQRMVDWRLQNDVDTFLDHYTPPRLFQYLPVFLCQGLDREGDPIYVERFGVGDQYGLVLAFGGSVEPLAQYTMFIRELTTTRRRRANSSRYCWQRDYYEPLTHKRMTQFTAIMDMQDLNHRNIRGGLLGLLQRMARISQDYYAGMAKRVIILRAPAIFEWGWNSVVKHFFDEHIRKLIVFTSPEDYLQVMDEYIDLTVLPPCLAPGHGTGKAMPGYFDRVRLEGGLIPSKKEKVENNNNNNNNNGSDHFAPLHEVSIRDQQSSPQDSTKMSYATSSPQVAVTVGLLLKGKWGLSSCTTECTSPENGSQGASVEVTVFQ